MTTESDLANAVLADIPVLEGATTAMTDAQNQLISDSQALAKVVLGSSGGGGGGGNPPPQQNPPSAPTAVQALAGNGQVTLSWTVPPSQLPISQYTVVPYIAGVAQVPQVVTATNEALNVRSTKSGTASASASSVVLSWSGAATTGNILTAG